MTSSKSYDIIINLSDKRLPDKFKNHIDLHIDKPNFENVEKKFKDSNLSASDLRSKTLVIFGENLFSNLTLYSTLIGFSGRRLEIYSHGELIDAPKIHHLQLINKISPRPENVLECIEYHDYLERDYTENQVRYAKVFNLDFDKVKDFKKLLTDFIVISGNRIRNNGDHLPSISTNGETVSLDEFRKLGNKIRRENKVDNRTALFEFKEPSKREARLELASNSPVELALSYLGSYVDDESGFWRCTRPERHRNGDENPSLKINEGKIRCYRCDYEPLDSLRLIIDTENISADEACTVIEKYME